LLTKIKWMPWQNRKVQPRKKRMTISLLRLQRNLKSFLNKLQPTLRRQLLLSQILQRKDQKRADPSKRIKRWTISKNVLASSKMNVVN